MTAQYAYDELGRLIREDNRNAAKTVLYTYDKGGNILTRKKYAFTLTTPGTLKQTDTYTYDSTWKDRLTSYSGYSGTMSYTGGNPNTYKGYTMTWEKGRQLKGMTKSGASLAFEYNAAGIRTKKTADGIVHNYYLNGLNILFETIECATTVDVLEYVYDENGNAAGIKYNGDTYLYEKNLQGDVIRLLDIEGQVVVNYVYDAWGKVEKITDANGTDLSSNATYIANVNPIRYRSYYYDIETQLYYLQSRYYDPETGRFINADDAKQIGCNDITDVNLFVYCYNDPVDFFDRKGDFALGFAAILMGVKVLLEAVIVAGAVATGIALTVALFQELDDIIQNVKSKAKKNNKRKKKYHKHHVIAKAASKVIPAKTERTIYRIY